MTQEFEPRLLADQLLIAQAKVQMVGKGIKTCYGLSGPPGIGKTKLVVETLESMRVPYAICRGSASTLLTQAHRLKERGVIILDDADGLVTGGGSAQLNLVKQLIAEPGRDGSRLIVHETLTAQRNAERGNQRSHAIAPPRFKSRCGTIWITNKTGASSEVSAKNREHYVAVLDRGLRPDRLTDDPRNLLAYVLHIATEGNFLRNYRARTPKGPSQLSVVAMNEVLDFFVQHAWRLQSISVRALRDIAMYRLGQPSMWRQLVTLLDEPRYKYHLPCVPYISLPVFARGNTIIELPDLSVGNPRTDNV